MANERALGLCRSSTPPRPGGSSRRSLGEHEARALFGLTNVLVMFGGSKDVAFNQEISDLLGTARVARTTYNRGRIHGRRAPSPATTSPILRPEEIRQLPERHALVIAENGKPIIARLTRCIDGKPGRALLAAQAAAAARVAPRPRRQTPSAAHNAAALTAATALDLSPSHAVPRRRPAGDDPAAEVVHPSSER